MTDILISDGRFTIETAASSYEAGIQTQQFLPDLILLDYMLPDINGNIVCHTIKKNPKFESIKIIIVSGVANEQEISQLMNSGAEDFIKKPFNITELVSKIASTLQMN